MQRDRKDTPRPCRARLAGAYMLLVVAVCALDQAVKAWARTALSGGLDVQVIPGALSLSLVRNEGAAFGILQGHALAFAAFAFVVVAACAAWAILGRRHDALRVACAGLVSAGAVGNAIDRVCSGAVTDMLRLTLVDFPVFNVADIAITCGFVLFVVSLVLDGDDDASTSGASAGEGGAA